MPENLTEEQERLAVEAMIKEKQELQEKIIDKAKEKNIKVLYFKHQSTPTVEGRYLAIINVAEKDAGLTCDVELNGFDWYGLFMLHKNRIKMLEEIINSEDILSNSVVWGYLDTNNKLHTAEGVKQLNFQDNYANGLYYYYYKKSDDTFDYIVQEREEQFQTCYECGRKMINDESMVKTYDGKFFCKSCAEGNNIGVCDICGKVHKRSKITLDAESVLPGRSIGETIQICYHCVDETFNHCDNCGRLIRKPNHACSDCKFSVILNYSTKPAPVFKALKNEKTKQYFGWEWEIETRNSPRDIAKIANQTGNGLMYCKHDGSIRNGCEVVTHPMTYNFFKKNAIMFQEMFDKIKKAGGHSLDMENTGVHIHISRDAFDSPDHIINFARCITQPSAFSEFIALRKGNRYAHYNKSTTAAIKKEYEGVRYRDRYRAVNFCNRNTIEVRIYKGTISYDAILMYLQHIICCMEYSKQMKITGKFKLDKLLDFILAKSNKSFTLLRARTRLFRYMTKYEIKE